VVEKLRMDGHVSQDAAGKREITFCAVVFTGSYSDSAQSCTGTITFESSTLLRLTSGQVIMHSNAWAAAFRDELQGGESRDTHQGDQLEVVHIVLKCIGHETEPAKTHDLPECCLVLRHLFANRYISIIDH